MSPSLVLLTYALLLSTVGAALLRRSRWVDRAPGLGIAAWQIVSASVVLAVVLGAAALVVPIPSLSTDLAALLKACVMALQAQYAAPGGIIAGAAGAVLAAGVTSRVACCTTATLLNVRRQRHRQVDALTLLARRDDRLGALVVDHDTAVAYCLPGRGRRVVLTSAAVAALGHGELTAVIAHEYAHLRGRHHLVLAGAQALARAFPGLPVFRDARDEIARLVEMLADDAAARRCERHSLARALVTLAEAPAPGAALGAGGPTAVVRVLRLLAPAHPLSRAHTAAVAGLAVLVLAAPVAVAVGPAIIAAQLPYCPIY